MCTMRPSASADASQYSAAAAAEELRKEGNVAFQRKEYVRAEQLYTRVCARFHQFIHWYAPYLYLLMSSA